MVCVTNHRQLASELTHRTSDATKMRRAGGGRSDTERGQDQADRVLSRIRGKLGTELSTEYRVNQLIQEARDPEHLAKIFVGE